MLAWYVHYRTGLLASSDVAKVRKDIFAGRARRQGLGKFLGVARRVQTGLNLWVEGLRL